MTTNTQGTNIELEHATNGFSPSGADRWMTCHASVKMIRDLNLPRTSNKYADHGSCAHKLGEILLLDRALSADEFIGKKLYANIKVDQEMVNGINEYIEHVSSYETLTSETYIENRVSLEHLTPGTFGTTDAVIVDTNVIHVIDLKFGRGLVEVENNLQLQLYAIGTVIDLIKKGKDISLISEVVLHIVQPRGIHPNGPIRTWSTTIEYLKSTSRRAKDAIINACSDDPDFNPNRKACAWCEASGVCRPLAEYNLALATNDFQEFATMEQEDFKDANKLSKEEISELIGHTDMITAWINSITSSALDSLRRGESVPNYKLVRGRSIRKWDSLDELDIIEKLASLDFRHSDLYTEKFKSPTQIEKLVTKDQYEEIVKPMVVKPKGKITIAHTSDKRKAVNPDLEASKEFKEYI